MKDFLFNVLKALGCVWTLTNTLLALMYVGLFCALRWYKFHKASHWALVFIVNDEKAPGWLKKMWSKWGGHTIGNVIVVKYDTATESGSAILEHEARHVTQYQKLGPFFLPMYWLVSLAILVACPSLHAYHSNVFEVDASNV